MRITGNFYINNAVELNAEELYKRAMTLVDESAETLTEAQIQEITELLDQAIQLDPNHPGAYIARGLIIGYSLSSDIGLKENHSYRELAIADLTNAIALNPDYSDEYLDKGTAQYYRGILRFMEIGNDLLEGKLPSMEKVNEVEDDLNFALSCEIKDAQNILMALENLKKAI